MIRLPARYAREMVEHAQAEAPQEACGVLAGREGRITKLYRAQNVAEDPRIAYLMEPHEQLRIFLEIEEQGWEILGLYHSHPASPAYPSPSDVAQAYYPDSLYFVISLAGDEPVIRAFHIDREEGEVQEEEVVLVVGESVADEEVLSVRQHLTG